MIISKLQGGLGNQLFQWAYAYSLAVEFDRDFYLDTRSYYFDKKRRYELYKFPNLSKGLNIIPLSVNDKRASQENINQDFITEHVIDDFNCRPLYLFNNVAYILEGYWQSEKYFTFCKNVIRDMLQPTDLQRLELRDKIKENSVSIHVRRSDYLETNGYHPVQPLAYFEEALKVVDDYKYIYVFSDDMQWCKENLKYDNIEFVTGHDNIDDLWMMSMCKHNIISNSTFSWWGAWINGYANKTVVAPRQWFGSHVDLNTDDIIPEDWIQI